MEELAISLDTVWMLLAAMLVFWMQPGFALCEAGFTRSKNSVNILMKNFVDFILGSLLFFFVGFGFMFGSDGAGFIGAPNWGDLSFYKGDLPVEGFLVFETVFCATAATIVSGAMAERTKFNMYLVYSAVISLLIYPVEGHWTWGGGWLSEMGFHDFAGSAIVHSVGGVLALIGAIALGPRIGKYKEFPFDANPVKVRFTFSHLLAKVEFRAYYVGAESEITVNQITLKSPDNNTPTVLLDGGSTNVSRVFNASNTTTQLGTPGSGQSKDIMPEAVALHDSVFFDELPGSVPKYQTLCSWLTFPCSFWNNLNLSVNYSISGAALTGTSQGLTLSTPVNEEPNTGITLPGHSYVVTLKFTISSGIEIESIQVKDWEEATPYEPEVYNW